MAYDSKNLSVLAYANGFTLWHYTSVDAAAEVDSADYFATASDMLRVGDFIMANTDTDGTPVHGIFVVSAVGAGTVDVNDITQISGTDTD